MAHRSFACGCFSPEHVVLFDYFHWKSGPELIIHSQLRTRTSFWTRLKTAIRYVFIGKSSEYPWEETLLRGKEIVRLKEFLQTELDKQPIEITK